MRVRTKILRVIVLLRWKIYEQVASGLIKKISRLVEKKVKNRFYTYKNFVASVLMYSQAL